MAHVSWENASIQDKWEFYLLCSAGGHTLGEKAIEFLQVLGLNISGWSDRSWGDCWEDFHKRVEDRECQ